MAKQDKDELAKALAAMSSGEHTPSDEHAAADQLSEHEPPPPPPNLRTPAPRTPSPKIPGPPSPPIAPVTPVASKPRAAAPSARPVQPASPTTPPRPVDPLRAPPKRERPAAPTLRPQAPQAPVAPPLQEVDENSEGEIIDDDDAVIVPAPSAAVFAPKKKPVTTPKVRVPMYRTTEFRQTIIPVLLTSGLILLVFAATKFISDQDSAFASLPMWLPASAAIMGVTLLVLAVLNMLAVKQILEQASRK